MHRSNPYGRFVDNGSAFEITDPFAPMPWTNVICNGRYGLVVSQNGGGFSWLDHCQLNVITRWDMDLARDERGRFVYVSDLDAGPGDERVWSLSPQPCHTRFDRYSCTHRPGSTTFATEANGIAAEWTLAATPSDTAEVWRVRLTNESGRPRRLRMCAFFEWCCGAAPDVKREFHKLFFTTGYDAGRNAIVATKNMWEAPFGNSDDHWNRPWPHTAAFGAGGFEAGRTIALGDKTAFLGRYADQAKPAAMLAESHRTDTFGRFGDACAALGGDLDLAPGETREFAFVLAVGDDRAGALALVDAFNTPEAASEAIERAEGDWGERLGKTRVQTGAEDFDLLNNTWLTYQAISARMWGRAGYYQQSGAYGYRDQLQDSQVWLAIDPEKTAEQIMLHAAHQFADGTVYHWWNPITETGNVTRCSDDYLWLPFVTASYLRETGDFSILERTARFIDDEHEQPLIEHCRRAIARSFARQTERGLPLIGDMDWNDGLSALGTETGGESVWLAQFLHGILGDWVQILGTVGDEELARGYGQQRDALERAINDHAWDGAWFRRATDRDGGWLGSKDNDVGQIFLNAQTWAILNDVTTPERADAAWASVKDWLLTDYGPLLLAPAYTEPDPRIGYITRYAPGARENGGVYMHAATWALAAACKLRDVEAAGRIWRSVSPPTRGSDAEAYFAEPYVLPGNVDGPLSGTPGRAGWTWYTGSAAWLNRVSLEWVLGVRPVWGGLLIDPCPPAELGEVTVERNWHGRRVRVRFDARAYDPSAKPVIELDGQEIVGGVIKEGDLPASGGTAEVIVRWKVDRTLGLGEVEAKRAAMAAAGRDAR